MRYIFLTLFLIISSAPATAVQFEVYQSSYNPLNLALLVNTQNSEHQNLFARVIGHDLESSRSFRYIDPLSYLVDAKTAWEGVDYSDWRIVGTDVLVVMNIESTEAGLKANLRIHDPFRTKLLDSHAIVQVKGETLRHYAHRIADYIYHQQTGLPGYFTSYIVFVEKKNGLSDLLMMEHDGEALQKVGKNFTLLLSPDISPDRSTVALNTYEGNRPKLEFFHLADGKRQTFASYKGLNSTPEFSPDGRYIAATLSHTGNSEIHIYDIKQQKWKQFTHDDAIDTTPTWSPDGKWIAFTSNRNGTPQIYRKRLSGGKAEKISLSGNYNTSPSWAPIGDRIVFVTKKEWEYAIATVHIDGTGLRYLATGQRIESPAWSPNGQMILYSAEENSQKYVYSVPVWGGEAIRVSPRNMNASDPAWSK